jgi:hypothetical protein
MPYTVSGTDIRGVNTIKRKTSELALKKARELTKRGCYNVQITTPEGRTYSSEFGDLPHTPVARRRPSQKHPIGGVSFCAWSHHP